MVSNVVQWVSSVLKTNGFQCVPMVLPCFKTNGFQWCAILLHTAEQIHETSMSNEKCQCNGIACEGKQIPVVDVVTKF